MNDDAQRDLVAVCGDSRGRAWAVLRGHDALLAAVLYGHLNFLVLGLHARAEYYAFSHMFAASSLLRWRLNARFGHTGDWILEISLLMWEALIYFLGAGCVCCVQPYGFCQGSCSASSHRLLVQGCTNTTNPPW